MAKPKDKTIEDFRTCRTGLNNLFEAAMAGDEVARADLVEALAIVMEAAGKIISERDRHHLS
jgi:hypothetical protein